MKKLLISCLVILSVTSCRTRKVVSNDEQRSEKQDVKIARENEAVKSLQELKNRVEKSRVFDFNQALSLSPVVDSTGVAQPVSYRELREGRPYREIYIQGGTLNENKSQTDTLKDFIYKRLQQENTALKMRLDSLVSVVSKTYAKNKKVKVTGVQFGVYLIVAIVLLFAMLLGYVEYRIRQFKRSLKPF